jgi:hypothetical protein
VDNVGNSGAADSFTWSVDANGDTTPPTVDSIDRAAGAGNPTNAASVDFTVMFSEAVTGVGTGNFSLTTTGTMAGASVSSVTGSGATRTVTVGTGTGDGTVRLDLSNTAGIADLATNALAATHQGDEPFTLDRTKPTAAITSHPADPTNDTDASFGFTTADPTAGAVSSGVARADCKLDGGPFQACTSPRALTGLSEGSHTFSVRAVDNAGNNGVADPFTWTVDTSDSSTPSMIEPSDPFQFIQSKQTRFALSWRRAIDRNGVRNYDVQVRSAPAATGDFGPFATILAHVTGTKGMFTGVQGQTHCFRVRARDRAGNVTPYSAERCTAFPFDDRALTASDGWTRKSALGYFLNTYTTGKRQGATLTRRDVHASAIMVEVTKCPACGSIAVVADGHVVDTFDLSAPTTRFKRVLIVNLSSPINGDVQVRITSSDQRVEIDALGVSQR